MNFRDMTKDEKMYYEQIRVRHDDFDLFLAILSLTAAVTLVGVAIWLFA